MRRAAAAPRRTVRRSGALVALLAMLTAGAALGGCGDTIQANPIPHNQLEQLVVAQFPVYWAGGSFRGLKISEVTADPGGAFTVQYGSCLQGGQGTCTPPLRVVTNPDNSFLPGGEAPAGTEVIRGVPARSTEAGRVITIPTGVVVVGVFARDPALARAAAQQIVAINRPEDPGGTLPAGLPDTGFGSTPLPSQRPATARPLG